MWKDVKFIGGTELEIVYKFSFGVCGNRSGSTSYSLYPPVGFSFIFEVAVICGVQLVIVILTAVVVLFVSLE